MYNNWSVDSKQSRDAFVVIKDTVIPKLVDGDIYRVEGKPDQTLKVLDESAGIDYLCRSKNGVLGIAWRAQWGKVWSTFTIRSFRHTGSETELEKRKKELSLGYLYPTLTMHAYFDGQNNLLAIASMLTKDLYAFIEDNPESVYVDESDNQFLVVQWGKIISKGYPIKAAWRTKSGSLPIKKHGNLLF